MTILARLLFASRCRSPLFWWRLLLLAAAAGLSLLLVLQPPPWRVLAGAGGWDGMNLTRTITFWTWWAGLVSIVIITGLFLLCRWWVDAPAPQPPADQPKPGPRWFWPLTLAAVVACGAVSGPTLDHSLWDDESESVTWYSVGRFVRDGEQGEVRFKSIPWQRTLYGYSTPNNHIFHNILSRASNSLWRTIARPDNLHFNHLAVRLPAFLAALAAVAALAFLLRDFGYPGAGVLAAWFLALHPWFTEHAAVARGYSLAMLLAVLALIAWRRALLGGSWLWWTAFAAAQFLMMWTYPGSIFLLAPLNLATVLLLWHAPAPVTGPFRTQLSRWFCVNSITAAALFPLLLPLLPQLRVYNSDNAGYRIGGEWVHDTVWCFVGGAPWSRNSAGGSGHQDMQLVVTALGPAAPWLTAATVGIFFLLGLWYFARRNRLALALAAALVAAPVLQFFYARAATIHMWPWYVIYALPFVAMFWGMGLAITAVGFGRITGRPSLAAPLAAAFLAVFAFLNYPVHAWQLVHSKTPLRESVLATRSAPADYRSPGNRRIITFAHTNPVYCYDPSLLQVRSPAEIILLCLQADREGRPLIGNIGHPHVIKPLYPRDFALLQDRRLFGRKETFTGAEDVWDRYIYYYTPGAVAGIDLTEFLHEEEIAFVRQHGGTSPEQFFAPKVRPQPGDHTGSNRRDSAED